MPRRASSSTVARSRNLRLRWSTVWCRATESSLAVKLGSACRPWWMTCRPSSSSCVGRCARWRARLVLVAARRAVSAAASRMIPSSIRCSMGGRVDKKSCSSSGANGKASSPPTDGDDHPASGTALGCGGTTDGAAVVPLGTVPTTPPAAYAPEAVAAVSVAAIVAAADSTAAAAAAAAAPAAYAASNSSTACDMAVLTGRLFRARRRRRAVRVLREG